MTQILDLDTNAWSVGPELPASIADELDFSAAEFEDSILLFGAKIHEYCAGNNTWIERLETKTASKTGGVAVDVTGLGL